MDRSLKSFVEKGEVPGYVALVHRENRTEVECEGTRTQGGEPLTPDSLFRITSMTKPIAAVATLLLVDQGKIALTDPIERWVPELANRRVLKTFASPLTDTVPAARPPTIDDLLSFRMGFGMMMEFFSQPHPIYDRYQELGLLGLGPPDPSNPLTADEWLQRFATLPFVTQPGELWQYNTAYYLLGVVLARITGKDVDHLFRDLVFDPLGMSDTSFMVPASKAHRLTDCYWFDSQNRRLELHDSASESVWLRKPAFMDAAAGLVSSAPDFLSFAKMLMAEGLHEGKRFLSTELVRKMATNHLTDEQRAKPTLLPDQWSEHGFGYGVSVQLKTGRYGWDGGFGSTWKNDPQSSTIGILLTERTFDSPGLPPICGSFWRKVAQGF